MEAETNSPEYASTMAIDQPKTVTKVGAENEEWGDHQSEASSMEDVTTKHINDEGKIRLDSRAKSSYDVDELEKIPESQLVENSELMTGSKITTEEATNIKESNEDAAFQTLPNTAPVRVETVDESVQEEIHLEAELAATNAKMGQIPKNDFEEKVKILKAFGLLEVTHQTSLENELKAAFQSETQNWETTFKHHLNLEGVPEDVGAEAFDKSIQEEIHAKEELEVTTTKGKITENYFEQKMKVPKAFGLNQVAHQTGAENVLPAETQFKVQNKENSIIKHLNLERETTEINPISDTQKQEKVHESHTREPLENEDDGKFKQEKTKETEEATEMQLLKTATESVPEDPALQTLPNAASVNNEAVDESNQQDIQTEEEFAVTFAKEVQTRQYEFDAEMDISEEEIIQLRAENEHKSESQCAVQNDETTNIQHLYSDGQTAKINPTYDTEEQGQVPATHVKGKLQIEDDEKFDQYDAKGIEEETKTQLLNTAAESLPEDEVQSELPTPAIVQGDTDQIIQQKLFHHDESEAIENTRSCILENELDRRSTVVEEPDQPQSEDNVGLVKEEQAHHQSEGLSKQSVITNSTQGLLTSESSTKLYYDVNEQNTEESPRVENLENKDAGQITADKATDVGQLTDVEIQNSENEGVPEDPALQTLPNTASVNNEAVDDSNQKDIQTEEEFVVTSAKELQTRQHEFDVEKDISEEEMSQPSGENEHKSNWQPAVQNVETTNIQHPHSDGQTAEIYPKNDTEEQEQAPATHSKEKLLIEDDEIFDQEEAKGNEEATKTHLLNTAAESPPEEEVRPELPTPAIVQGDTDQIIQQQALHDDESKAIKNTSSCIPENELDRMSTVLEEPDKPGSEDNISTVKEEQADHQSEGSSMHSVITNNITEGLLTSESCTKLSSDVDEQKTEESHRVENLENRDAAKIPANEETDAEQSTAVEIQNSETKGEAIDTTLQTLPDVASVDNKAIDESIQEEMQPEEEFAVTPSKEVETQQYEFDAKKDIPEEETTQPSAENKHKSESQPAEINPTNDTEEQEEVPATRAKEILKIEDDEKFNQAEANSIEEETKMQLLNTAAESPPEEEVQPELSTPAIVQGDTDQIKQQQAHHDDESEAIENTRSCIPENDLHRTSTVVEEPDQPESQDNIGIVKEEQADHQSEGSSMQSVITNYITEGLLTSESTAKLRYHADEQRTEESHGVETSENKEAGKIPADEETDAEQLTDVEIQNSETEGEPVVTAWQTLPNAALVDNKAIDESILKDIRSKEFAVTHSTGQHEFDAKKDIQEEETGQPRAENKHKSESQPAEINPTNDTEEQEEILATHAKEKLQIENHETIDQEEAKGVEKQTKTQLLNTAADSPPEAEVQQELPTPAIAQGDTDQIIQQQALHDDKPEAIENTRSCIPENELHRTSIVVEEPDQPESEDNVGMAKEEQADYQFEGSSMKSVITNYITEEGLLTSDSSTKLIYDVDEQKTEESHGVEILENKDAGKIPADKETDAEQLTDVEIQNLETEGAPIDTALQTLPDAASVDNKANDESIQEEVQPEEFTVTHSKEVQTRQYEFDAKKDIPEEETGQPRAENKHKSESQPAEINPTNDTEEQEEIPATHTKEKLQIENDETIDQEEATGIEKQTKIQLLNTAAESPPEEEVQPELPTPAIVQGDTDQIIQQQALHDDESEEIENTRSCIPENKLHRTSSVVEEPESEDNIGAVKVEQAEHQCEGSSMLGVIKNYITEEGFLTSQSSTKLSYDMDEQKTEESHGVENLESKDAGAPVYTALQTLPDATSVENKALDGSNQEEIQPAEEFEVTPVKEVQTRQHEIDVKKDISREETTQPSAENEHRSELHRAVPNNETTNIQHLYSDRQTAEIKSTNDTEEQEEVPANHTKEKLLIQDDEKFDQDEEKGVEEAMKTQLLNTATESPPEKEVQTELHTPAIVQGDMDQIIQQQASHNDESEAIKNTRSPIPENQLDRKSTVVEEPDQPESKHNVSMVKEEQADQQSEGSNMQSVITNYITEKRLLTSESSTKLSYDVDEQKTEESHRVENLKNNDAGKIPADKATNVEQLTDVEIKNSKTKGAHTALQTLPDTASVENKTVDESIQEEIQQEVQTRQYEFDAKKDIPEEETSQPSAENAHKSESLRAVPNDETTNTQHPYSDEQTTEINPTNDTEEQKEVPATHAKEKLEIQDDEKFDQEEAKAIEEETKTQLLNSAAESPPGEEVQLELPTPAIVQGDKDQIIQQQALHDDESEAIENTRSCIPENEHDRTSTVVEEPESEDNVGMVKEEQADNQSEGSSMQSVIINYITKEGLLKSESSSKLSYDVDEQKTEESHRVEKLENKDAGKIMADEATDVEKLIDVEIQNSITEGAPENTVLQTLPDTASVKSKALDESNQEEIQPAEEFAVTLAKEVQTRQYEFNAKKDIREEETSQPSAENEHKSQSQPAVQNDETPNIQHPYSDGHIEEINPANDTEEQEEVPSTHAKEKLLIEDYEKFDQVEAKAIEEATKMQLLDNAAENPPEEEGQPELSTPAIVQGDTDQIIQQQARHDDKSEVIENTRSCIPENDLHRTSTVVEEPDQPESEDNVATVKEEQAGHQSEGSSMQSVIANYIAEEGLLTSESSTKLSYDVDEQKTVESHGVENLENKDAGKIPADKEIDAEQLTDVEIQNSETEGAPGDTALQTLPDTASVQNKAIDESIHEEVQPKEEFAVTPAKEVQTRQYELDVKKDIPEEETSQPSAENKQQSESPPAVQKEETTFTEHPYSDGETSEINTTNDTEEQGKVPASHAKEKLGIEVDEKFDQGEAKEIEQATKTQLLNTATEMTGLQEEEVQLKLPTPAIVQGDTDQIIKQQELHHDESDEIDNANSCMPEKELDRMTTVVEEPGQPESKDNVAIVKEEQADHQSEGSSMQSVITNYITEEGLLTTESSTKLSYDVDEQKTERSHSLENLENKDARNVKAEEAKEAKQLTEVEIQKSETEGVPEDKARQLPNAASIDNEAVDEHSQEEIQLEAEFAVTYTKEVQTTQYDFDAKKDIPEAIDQHETMNKIGEENEEHADHQSEASSMQGVIAKHIHAEEIVISEGKTNSSYDVDKLEKIVDPHLIENLESKDGCKITAEEATNKKQLTETKSVLEDKALQTIPSTASVGIEEVDKSIQEIHTETELAVIDTKEGQMSENYSEAKKEVSENMLKKAFDLHKVTCQASAGNEQKAELLSEQQSQETTVTKHPNLKGETIEINPTNETEEYEKVPTSHTGEKLEINDDGNFIQEKEKEMEKATERKLLKTAKESVPEDEAQTTLPTSTIVKGEMVERIVLEQTLEEGESTAIDNNNSGRPENELEQMANVVETIDQHETMAKVNAENEERANHQSEQSSMGNVITKHINSEGTVTTENSTKSSYDVEELLKVLTSDSIDNSEIKYGGKIMPEEASEKKEGATGMELQKPEIESVPEDKAISTLYTIPSVRVETVEERLQEEIQKEAEPAVTDTKEGKRPETDVLKNMEVLEAFDLHKVPGNTCVENAKKAEVQSEAKSQETMTLKHPNLDGLETAGMSPSNHTEVLEKDDEVAKPRGVSESVSADITEQTDTGKLETQEAETTQLGSTKEDEGGDEFEKISPSSSISVISRDSQDTDMKVSHKKSHGILSGVGSKVKHSISKVKKAITGKSSHQKTPSPKKENK